MLRKEKVQWLVFLHAIHAKALCKHVIGNKLESIFFAFNLLAVIYTRGWIQSLSEGGLTNFSVTSQLQWGTPGKIKEVGSILEGALREHQYGFEQRQGLKMLG